MIINTETINEQDALSVYYQLAKRFWWAGTIFTSEDIRNIIGDTATDEQIDKVMSTRMWRKMLEEALCAEGNECVLMAVEEAEEE